MPPIPITFSDTTPAAPGTDINVKWQTDGSGNLSAHVPASGGGGGSGAPSGTFHSVVVNAFGIGGNGSQIGAAAVTVGSVSGPFSASNNVALPWFRIESTGSASGITDDIQVISPATMQHIQFYAGIGSGSLGSGVLTGCRWWLGFSNLGIGSLNTTNPGGNIVAFRLDQSGGLNTPDTNWQAYVGNGSTETVVDTGVAPNPYISSGPPPYGDVTDQFKITSDGAGGWNFYIDGTKVANIPSGSPGMPAANTQMLYVMETDAQSGDTSQLFIHSMQWWSTF
jgi:hypothetical protein